MVSESKENFNLKINSLDCGIIDKSVSEVLGNLGRIYLVFTGIREMSRAGFLTAFREVEDLPRSQWNQNQVFQYVYTPGCPSQKSSMLMLWICPNQTWQILLIARALEL